MFVLDQPKAGILEVPQRLLQSLFDLCPRPVGSFQGTANRIRTIDAEIVRCERRQLLYGGIDESHASCRRSTLEVMKGGSQLNEPLQEALSRLIGFEPHRLP